MAIVAAAVTAAKLAAQVLPSMFGPDNKKLADTALVLALGKFLTLPFDWARYTLGKEIPADSASFRDGFSRVEMELVLAPNQACALIPQVKEANQKTLSAYVRSESKNNFVHATMVPVLLDMLNRICKGEVIRTPDTPGVAFASVAEVSAPVTAKDGLTSTLASVGLTPTSGFVLLLGLGLAGTMGIIALTRK